MNIGLQLGGLLSGLRALEPLDVTIPAALGAQIARDVVAPRPLPHFANCAVHGYALRSADVRPRLPLKVVDDVAPGFTSSQPVYAGVCVRVHEHVMLPKGADAVAADHLVVRSGDSITLAGPVAAGTGVNAAGSQVGPGEVLVPAGTVVDAATVGLLASAGIPRVAVRPQPRVVVVTVGTGLVRVGGPATDGLWFDAAGPLLAALATRAGAMAARVGPIPADSRSIRNALEDQLIRADLILVSGGSEPGEPGVRQYLLQQGEVAYDDTSTNLGSYGHGVLGEDRVPVLALPSDPVRAAMLFSVLAVPMLRTLRGLGPTGSDVFSLAQDVPRHPTATSLLLAKVDRHGWAFPLSGTPNTLDLSRSDAVIRILPGAGVMPRGARVPAERVGGDPRNG